MHRSFDRAVVGLTLVGFNFLSSNDFRQVVLSPCHSSHDASVVRCRPLPVPAK